MAVQSFNDTYLQDGTVPGGGADGGRASESVPSAKGKPRLDLSAETDSPRVTVNTLESSPRSVPSGSKSGADIQRYNEAGV